MSSLNNLPRPIKASIHYSCLLLSEPDRQRIKTQMALLLPFLSLCPTSPVIFGVSSFLGASTTLILSQEFNVVMRWTITIIVLRRSLGAWKKSMHSWRYGEVSVLMGESRCFLYVLCQTGNRGSRQYRHTTVTPTYQFPVVTWKRDHF